MVYRMSSVCAIMKWLWLLSLPFSFWSNQTHMRGVPDRCIDVSVFSQEWLDFKEPLELFNDLGLDYTLRGGSVLAWYRDCALTKTLQVDIASRSFHAHVVQINLAVMNWDLSRRSTLHRVVVEEEWTKGDSQIVISMVDALIPKKKVRWNDLYFYVPDPVEEYLRDMYGNWSMVYLNT